MIGDTPSNALRPDAQAFDEVRIVTVPRWKESELSGDEWRISASIQFYRKGKLCHEAGFRNVEVACGFAFSEYMRACDDAKGYFAGEEGLCDQEGCKEPATVQLTRKVSHCNSCGQAGEYQSKSYRKFCKKHKRRGDCGIDDADRNYEPVPC